MSSVGRGLVRADGGGGGVAGQGARGLDPGGSGGLGQGGRGGAPGQGEGGGDWDAEEAAEAAHGARGAGGLAEEGHGVGVPEQMFELGADAGGAVAELLDEPGLATGDVWRGGGRPGGDGWRARGAGGVWAGEAAGGEVVQQADEAQAGAGEAVPERHGEGAEEAEIGGDNDQQQAQHGVQAAGQDGSRMGGVLRRGRAGRGDVTGDIHDTFLPHWQAGRKEKRFRFWGRGVCAGGSGGGRPGRVRCAGCGRWRAGR